MLAASCSYGHRYFPRAGSPGCPFCFDLLRQYRDYANRKGGTLVSRSPSEILVFKCHRKGHPEFPIQLSKIKSNQSAWCPECNPVNRRLNFPESHSSRSHGPSFNLRSRESEQRRLDALIEEGKRDQAKLLSSAKILYKIASRSSPINPATLTIATLFDRIQKEARSEFIKYLSLTELQCVVIHTLLTCNTSAGKPYTWELLDKAVPNTQGRDKLYKRCARLVHPDKCSHPKADEAFKILSSIFN